MSDLIQLRNGDWVDPCEVVAIVALPALPVEEFRPAPIPPRVRVDWRFRDADPYAFGVSGQARYMTALIYFDFDDEAEAYRDGLAAQVNAARQAADVPAVVSAKDGGA